MTSLKGELLPRIVKRQFPSPKRLKKSREVWKGVQAEGETDIAAHKPILSPSELPGYIISTIWHQRECNSKTYFVSKGINYRLNYFFSIATPRKLTTD